ncbi:four-helix bundle copper-binding protein [Myxococcus stipitatus]|uniref:four-helix bundle copper-binding protein n=1 Tax=Myxococcus stipitatus TaxID=83455 RepID=UPI001F33053A|nr:four-helix bundle copper-binding protein [Myxococcus stipitatus]MCE9667108.1 four-helix bundle copper-binding protein [Myxococcus stipitatus]
MAQMESQRFSLQPFVPAMGDQLTEEMRACISQCMSCSAICTQAMTYCLRKGGRFAGMELIRMLEDCSRMCATSAGFLLRGSPLHVRTCGVCAEVCERCAVECERMGDDPAMKACADACRRCAESCRRMSASA